MPRCAYREHTMPVLLPAPPIAVKAFVPERLNAERLVRRDIAAASTIIARPPRPATTAVIHAPHAKASRPAIAHKEPL